MKADTRLTEEQKRILLEKGTERPFSGALLRNKEKGSYHCAACGTVLFLSEDKFDSGTGWPSFSSATEDVGRRPDHSHGMKRVEVFCRRCGGHLGHLFDDGPGPEGKRYCINSLALEFKGRGGVQEGGRDLRPKKS